MTGVEFRHMIVGMDFQKIGRYFPYLIPIVGVLFFNWSAFGVLLFFCIENILQGVFFLLRGIVSVHYGGGTGFLIAFCFLYFMHALGMTQMIFYLGQTLGIMSIPSFGILAINAAILSVPHFVNLFQFEASLKVITPIVSQTGISKNEIISDMKKEDMTPIIDLLLNTKEMFYRVGALWLTTPFAFIIVFLSLTFKFPPLLISVLLISVFSFFHYFSDKYALLERQKIMGMYQSWRVAPDEKAKG